MTPEEIAEMARVLRTNAWYTPEGFDTIKAYQFRAAEMLERIVSVIESAHAEQHEADCAAVCPLCSHIIPGYDNAEKSLSGMWVHMLTGFPPESHAECSASNIRNQAKP